MKYDQVAVRESQRKAFDVITAPKTTIKDSSGNICDVDNPFWVNPLNVTMPMKLVQELPWVNTGQQFNFDFSINAPVQVPGTNNNVILGQNNVFVAYGIQILFRDGASSANGVYRSFGNTANDDALYNSLISIRLEQSTLIDKVNGQDFRDVPNAVTEYNSLDGMLLINPVRILTGKLGTFTLSINLLNPISALVISANQFVSARLVGAYGQASA